MSLNSSLQNIMNDFLVSTSPYVEYFPLGKNVFGAVESRLSFPYMNLSENENGLQATVEVPGIDPNDINVELKNGYVVISTQKENEQENQVFHTYERRYGSFTRKFKAYNSTKDEDISARCVNGLLTVSVRKPQNESNTINRIRVSTI